VSKQNRTPATPAPTPGNSWLPLLVVLFVGSGCSALIYEIVWYQLLQLVIGSTAISLGVLLATFMGGLCAGSLVAPRVLSKGWHPLRVYAFIELAIGIFGILALLAMPLIDRLYLSAAGHGVPAMFLRAFICAICLLPPTFLMGASLPAAARWVAVSRDGVSWLGLLYGGNTAGAVFGCFAAGFYLLRVFDMATATYAAAAINFAVTGISWMLASRTVYQPAKVMTPALSVRNTAWPIYVTIALSGACALGAEVVWTRLLGLLLGATVYTFSIILAVFLIGLGIGSSVASLLERRIVRPQVAIGICQLLLTLAIVWTAYTIANWLPYWPAQVLNRTPSVMFETDLIRCIWAILPAACLWGASFPLALASVVSRNEDAGRMVGGIYAANTAGAILGALSFSLVLIPSIGTRRSESLLIALAAAAGLIALFPALRPLRGKIGGYLAAATAFALLLAWTVPEVPPALVAYGRRMVASAPRSKIFYVGEGMNSSIAISDWDDGSIQFHVSGKVEASTEPFDMRLQRMLGHLPALFHPQPHSVLIVGFGAGVTAGSFTLHPTIQRIVICEMEPLVPRIATQYFGRENYNVVNDPRTQLVYDDARHFVLTTPEKFDIITSDPIHPWVKGSATLYSKEYFEMVKRHLNPGGVVTQWVPLYESNQATVKSEIATFFNVFPNGTIWANENAGGGYDLVLLGQAEPMPIDVDTLERRTREPDYRRVFMSLYEVGFHSVMNMLAVYAGQASDLKPWLVDAEINRDSNLRLQYLAGMALNNNLELSIYEDILQYRKFPEHLFTISDDRKQVLRSSLGFK
jgi:spermidine synthase